MHGKKKRIRRTSRRKTGNPFCLLCGGEGVVEVRMRTKDGDEERWVEVPCPYCTAQAAQGIQIPLRLPREPRIPTPRGSGRGQGGRISRGGPVPLHWEIRGGKGQDTGPVLHQYDERYRPPEKAIVERPKKEFPRRHDVEEEAETEYEIAEGEPEVEVTFTLGGADESRSPELNIEDGDTAALNPNPSHQIDVPADGYPGEANLDVAPEDPLDLRPGEPGSLRHDVLGREELGDDFLFDEPGARDILD